ncbi:MAG: PTS transporter subunit IIC [Candidatus Adiutrix sp.]
MSTEDAALKKISFLKRKNIELSVHRYGIEAMGAMALGLFASLLVGMIIQTIGDKAGIQWMVDFGKMAMSMMGPAIAVAVAFGLKAPPLVLFAATAVGQAAVMAKGGPAGCFVAAVFAAEFGKMVSKETKVDIIVTPAVTLIVGIAVANFVGPYIGGAMKWIGEVIMWATHLQPIPMGIMVAVLMGLALTAPISSAAIAVMLELSGLAAGAATVGCCCQMVGFAVISYRENKFGGLVAQGVGTSMLQVPNIVRNPLILIPPTLASAILGPFATTVAQMENNPAGAGMGTSGFVGQFGTIASMGTDIMVFVKIGLLHFILPAILALVIAEYMRKKNWIKPGDLKLDI